MTSLVHFQTNMHCISCYWIEQHGWVTSNWMIQARVTLQKLSLCFILFFKEAIQTKLTELQLNQSFMVRCEECDCGNRWEHRKVQHCMYQAISCAENRSNVTQTLQTSKLLPYSMSQLGFLRSLLNLSNACQLSMTISYMYLFINWWLSSLWDCLN